MCMFSIVKGFKISDTLFCRVFHRVDLGVQAELAMLEEEKAGLLEQVEELGAKYLKAQSDIRSLQQKCLFVMEEKEREAAVTQQCQCEKWQLQNCTQDLNAELQSCRYLKYCLAVALPDRYGYCNMQHKIAIVHSLHCYLTVLLSPSVMAAVISLIPRPRPAFCCL